ncbi:MAG: sigma-70 family RNA polymerase sigma factor [Paludisphaera borealis]|uniref:sigma-70 family RNA polymerase sigma factor n=1 Tax=Paludisphaera borealis TaxID=1387353 RepID=UPI002850A0E4|nr:sigma-70 family RNA polymerase sigma factor [Paludisphaera borealis]MDR3620387.1 sigma-70 family RNA polymerase sigma factor [Paludisphaera borealis]
MQRDAAGETLRQIRTLYATGAAGGLSDGQLVERFLDRDGLDREDAFSALVHRHGPMVLAVCRRMLASPADADDAFQAVFLVLARKAGSLRRVDRLKPWLYGAAVRTARESRRRSARLRVREGGGLDHEPPCPALDPDLFELRALLDEELDRLPGRFREPLLLCELEGASRQDAARRLGLPEGTLSSRLARGRSLLRDRLTRRGVALGAGALAISLDGPATAGPTVAATVRLALNFAARGPAAGTVPTALASLAEGVLPMVATFKLKTVLAAALALGLAACLSAGLASQPPDPPPAPAITEAETKPEPIAARGVVVDESGAAVAGAEVRFAAYSILEVRGVTGPDGGFALSIPGGRVDGRPLLVRTADGRKLGATEYGYNLSRAEAVAPVRIVVKPGRPVDVRVTRPNLEPIAGAEVEAAGDLGGLDHATTDAHGAARLLVPPDAEVSWIVAQKKATGYDYAEFEGLDESGRARRGTPAGMLPAVVALTLDAPRTVRVKALGGDGKPVAGVDFYVWTLHKDGRQSLVNYMSRLHHATADADGIATFDWLPKTQSNFAFFPTSAAYAHRRAVLQRDGETYVARLARTETIRGRVWLPDGSPASDVRVVAMGSGRGLEHGSGRGRTEADGSYEMAVPPGEVYIVYVEDENWAAPSRLDVFVRGGKPVEGVDFRLGKGTVVRGTVTSELNGRPAVGELVVLTENAKEPPEGLEPEPESYEIMGDGRPIRTIPVPRSWDPGFRLSRQAHATTDGRGRYAIRVGPGDYELKAGSMQAKGEAITVANEPELVHDLRVRIEPRVREILLTGMAFGPDGKPVVGADVRINDEEGRQVFGMFPTRTDADGRFRIQRTALKAHLEVKSADGSLAGFAEIARDQKDVSLSLDPTASASGGLLDDVGQRAAGKEITYWGRWIVAGEQRAGPTFIWRAMTDDEGRFTLPSLLVGWTYEVFTMRGNDAVKLGVAAPKAPGPLDLGTLRMRDLGK